MIGFTFEKEQAKLLSGSSYEIGRKHGEMFKDKIQISLKTYEKMFWEYSNLNWKKACEQAKLHLESIRKFNPNYLEEMEGIATGASVSFEDILALNTRSELALVSKIDGCTSLYLTNSHNDNTWLGQNWDWKSSQSESIINISLKQEGLPVINMITEAGIIGKIGCNSAGIGVCLNALSTDTWKPKVPIHLGLRAILESNSLDKALSQINKNQMASAAHFLIASGEGKGISAEVSPEYTSILKEDEGTLIHTNHICSKKLKTMVSEYAIEDSFNRLDTIEGQLSKIKEKNFNEVDLFNVLSNHKNYPNSICRHESDEQPEKERMETVFSITMNLNEPKIFWIYGKPCEVQSGNVQRVM